MLISTDDDHNQFFNQYSYLSFISHFIALFDLNSTFFQRMMFEEKNIKMIEHIKTVLDEIYSD